MALFRLCTDRNRRVLVLAGLEARQLGERRVSTEHLLLGLVREAPLPFPPAPAGRQRADFPLSETQPVGARALEALGLSAGQVVEGVRAAISADPGPYGPAAGPGSHGPAADPLPASLDLDQPSAPLGRRATASIARETREARRLEDLYLGTGHQLLAMYWVRRGVARQVLTDLGVSRREDLVEAIRSVDTARDQLRRRVATLAVGNQSVLEDVVTLMSGTARPSAWTRRRLHTEIARLAAQA